MSEKIIAFGKLYFFRRIKQLKKKYCTIIKCVENNFKVFQWD